jgi:hypothetical protein
MTLRILLAASLLAAVPAALRAEMSGDPAEIRTIAKEAYVYGFPLVDNYRVIHAFALDPGGPEYKAPLNQLSHSARLFGPEDRTVQTPNSDTLYSFVTLDLRAEPMVLALPAVEEGRYYSTQLVDLYTHNFAYLGTRTTGNGGGRFLVAGPGWKGDVPPGIARVLSSETQLVLAIYRTQLFGPADLDAVKQIQAGYAVQPLSAFLGEPAPPEPPPLDLPRPLSPADERRSLAFFDVLRGVLELCPTHPSEEALRALFAKIGVVPGEPFPPGELTPEQQTALREGMADGQESIDAARSSEASAANLFGTREFLKNDYVKRALGAQNGIYGNSKNEAFYVMYRQGADGRALDGSAKRYLLRFPPGRLPPAQAFWSVTLYGLPDQLLVANPLGRYLINSPMLPQLRRDEDGGLTLLVQRDSPGEVAESNWLPAPDGPFFLVLRLYLPGPEVLSGAWTSPPLALRED